jgi:hypothetical protein
MGRRWSTQNRTVGEGSRMEKDVPFRFHIVGHRFFSSREELRWCQAQSPIIYQSWHLTDLPPANAYQNKVGQPRDERLFLPVYGSMTPDHDLWKSPGPGVTGSIIGSGCDHEI